VKIAAIIVLAGTLNACSSSSSSTKVTKAPTGTLITIVHDVPICNAITAAVVVQNLTFTPVGNGSVAGYILTTPSFAPEIRLNLQQLRDFSTILYEGSVRAGNYDQANLSFELANLVAYDPTLLPPIHTFSVKLTTPKPVISLNPPLVITANRANVMVMDFNVLSMLATDTSGDLTGQIKPVVSFTQLASASGSGVINPTFTELDDLWGFVRSISNTNTTSNPTYTGSFQMQLLSPSTANAPAVPINITASSNLVGVTDLKHLLTDSYVEVDAVLDAQGNLAAKTVEVQAVEDPFPRISGVTASTALIGPILSIQTDPAGNPISLDMWVRDAEPDDTSSILLDAVYQVNLTANPTYQASIMGPNFANLTFGPQNLAVGQEVIVHGAYTRPATTTGSTAKLPYTVVPTAIFLKQQAMQGSLNSVVQIGSDDETGVFILTPCCTLQEGTPIYVVTNNQTTFVNATGLGSLTPLGSILVKGMPYYEPQATTINGVTIPAGTMVVQARQVHVLP